MAAMSLTRVLVVVLLSALAVSSAPTHPSARDGNPTAIPGGNPTAIPGGADGIAGADAAVTPLDEGADAGKTSDDMKEERREETHVLSAPMPHALPLFC